MSKPYCEGLGLSGARSKLPLAVCVRADLAVNTIDELIAYAKAQGDKPLSYGSVGIGSILRLADGILAGMLAGGRMRAIGVSDPVRVQAFPSVPTFAESRLLPGFKTLDVWAGVFVPAATPERTVTALHEAARASLADPDLLKALESATGTPLSPTNSLEQLAAFCAAEAKRFEAAAKRARLEPK